MAERATWDQTWFTIAVAMARRSRCDRDQVGAVIVDPTNRVVATAYNGPPAGYPVGSYLVRNTDRQFTIEVDDTCEKFCQRGKEGPTDETVHSYTDCVSLHAEANALMVCDREARLRGTIYTTSDVCWGCARLIANSGLARVVVPHDPEHDYRASAESYAFLRRCKITVDFL